jgi:hypothetical protein
MADSPEETVREVAEGIKMLMDMAAQQKPEVAQKLQQVGQAFMAAINELVGGGQQGGGGGARPVQESGQGTPVGPQGVV